MVQVKKAAVRDAITQSAFELISERGYSGTTLAQIAAQANTTTSNIYRYFDSKLEMFFAIFGPWLTAHLDDLQNRVDEIPDPRDRLMAIFLAVWRDIPNADNGFNNNLIQALATCKPEEHYSRALLVESENRISAMIATCVSADRLPTVGDNKLAHLMFMGGDGFAISVKLGGPSPPVEQIAAMMCALILGDD